jgi:hypothetical protein
LGRDPSQTGTTVGFHRLSHAGNSRGEHISSSA